MNNLQSSSCSTCAGVAGSHFLVQRQIPGCSGGLDAKPRGQVPAAYLPNEAHAQLYECKSAALWLGQCC